MFEDQQKKKKSTVRLIFCLFYNFFFLYFELQLLKTKILSKETDIPAGPEPLEVKCSAAGWGWACTAPFQALCCTHPLQREGRGSLLHTKTRLSGLKSQLQRAAAQNLPACLAIQVNVNWNKSTPRKSCYRTPRWENNANLYQWST